MAGCTWSRWLRCRDRRPRAAGRSLDEAQQPRLRRSLGIFGIGHCRQHLVESQRHRRCRRPAAADLRYQRRVVPLALLTLAAGCAPRFISGPRRSPPRPCPAGPSLVRRTRSSGGFRAQHTIIQLLLASTSWCSAFGRLADGGRACNAGAAYPRSPPLDGGQRRLRLSGRSAIEQISPSIAALGPCWRAPSSWSRSPQRLPSSNCRGGCRAAAIRRGAARIGYLSAPRRCN